MSTAVTGGCWTRGGSLGKRLPTAACPNPVGGMGRRNTRRAARVPVTHDADADTTIFLLDAGLSNLEAFAANAFFTAGMVLFEVPTGVVADTVGRRASYLLGTLTLAASTLLYVLLWQIEASFWAWAVVSILIGLGFTFFSGAVEAWLVDALTATGFTGQLDSVFARGQVVSGVAMLTGSVAGGFIAEQTSLGVPFVLRGVILVVMFGAAFRLMHDIGFTPEKGGRVTAEVRNILTASIDYGWRFPH